MARRAEAAPTSTGPAVVRENRAGTQRVVRLSIIYAGALLALFGILAASARAAPGGSTTGAVEALGVTGVVAAAVGLLGIFFALVAAPRRIEFLGGATVVVGRLGGRRRLPPTDLLEVHVLRTFREGWLSSAPVDLVEVGARGRRKTYLLEEHLLEGVRPYAPA